ncbi:hypothetical protein [Ferrimonas balearica]|uniref:hypothetical protein n=1 Tax=Ferrimonas balearica TaxID=44012 RepID=UPI001F167A81|nr:hypothetical protein [Ferrimonas balearica]MBY6094065.1 hypothetical protein [Ferrimonas balearica]
MPTLLQRLNADGAAAALPLLLLAILTAFGTTLVTPLMPQHALADFRAQELVRFGWENRAWALVGAGLVMPILALLMPQRWLLQLGLLGLAIGTALSAAKLLWGFPLMALSSGVLLSGTLLAVTNHSEHRSMALAARVALFFAGYQLGAGLSEMMVETSPLPAMGCTIVLALGLLWSSRSWPTEVAQRGPLRTMPWLALLPIAALLAYWQLPYLALQPWAPENASLPESVWADTMTVYLMVPLALLMAALWWQARWVWPHLAVLALLVAATVLISNQPPALLPQPLALFTMVINASGLWVKALLVGLSLAVLPKPWRPLWLVLILFLPKLLIVGWTLTLQHSLQWHHVVGMLLFWD